VSLEEKQLAFGNRYLAVLALGLLARNVEGDEPRQDVPKDKQLVIGIWYLTLGCY
jgi:hypothetical protein